MHAKIIIMNYHLLWVGSFQSRNGKPGIDIQPSIDNNNTKHNNNTMLLPITSIIVGST
jgi:hypothetical protein